ncbi:right-handed parallel beta-helix repeat-containing protein [Gimesia sp.]|uniref:right-handed parallel beta-helix repeat-containing protein n=1 Tax=Gimesia sp. TaxID=2024833 RepID=UPI003A8EFE96
MKRAWLGLFYFLCTPLILSANTPDSAPAPQSENVQADVAELFGDAGWFGRYHPHFGYRYQAGDTIGRIGGLSSFDGFLPLFEGEDSNSLFFLDARLLIDSDSTSLGSNVGFGARRYLPEWEKTVGTYLYYDTRNAGYANFSQVSGGAELLGDFWEGRLNWYVPTGTRRKQWGSSMSGTDNYYFSGHYLYGGTLTRYYQAAMTGVDMEAGRRILTGFNTDVRAFAGWYHFQAQGSQQAWGWKSRIESRINNQVALNLSVQNDRVFNTTVNFSVSFQWPSITGLKNGPRMDLTARDRLGESPERLRAIVVDNQEHASASNSLIRNPATGNPYYFMHVAAGGNSDGSYNDPYETLTKAFNDPRTQAGDLIVFDHRGNTETGDFTLAPGTQVMSSGPAQFINTQFGQQLLPGSNTGLFPQINGSFTMNDRTLLSGFRIVTIDESPSIKADGAQQITITHNTISNDANNGIFLENARDIFIRNNTLQAIDDDMIEIVDSSGQIVIADNTLRSLVSDAGPAVFGDAISVSVNNDAQIDIDRNTITSEVQGSDYGINITTNAGNITTRIRENTITGVDFSLAGGIRYTGKSSGFAETTITDNIILNDDDIVPGSAVFNGISINYQNGSANTNLSNNVIATNDHATGGRGIWLNYQTSGTTTTTVNNNTISDSTDNNVFYYGLIAEVSQGTNHDFFITDNKIGPNLFNIRVDVTNGAAANMQVSQNIFANNGGTSGDLLIYSENAGSDLTMQIFNNTAYQPFEFSTNSGGIIRIQDLADLSTNNNGVTVNATGNVVNAP